MGKIKKGLKKEVRKKVNKEASKSKNLKKERRPQKKRSEREKLVRGVAKELSKPNLLPVEGPLNECSMELIKLTDGGKTTEQASSSVGTSPSEPGWNLKECFVKLVRLEEVGKTKEQIISSEAPKADQEAGAESSKKLSPTPEAASAGDTLNPPELSMLVQQTPTAVQEAGAESSEKLCPTPEAYSSASDKPNPKEPGVIEQHTPTAVQEAGAESSKKLCQTPEASSTGDMTKPGVEVEKIPTSNMKDAGPATSSPGGCSFEQEFETKHAWDLIDCYFKDNCGLQSQAIESYNRFIKDGLPNIVTSCGNVTVEDRRNQFEQYHHTIEFTKAYMEGKVIGRTLEGNYFPLFPHEARSRNLNYTSMLSVDIRHTIKRIDAINYGRNIVDKTYEKVPIADIPVMVKSEICRLHGLSNEELSSYCEDPEDPGGYFIINGKEKVIVTQEKPANNKLFLFKPMCDSQYQYECEVRSALDCSTDRVSALWIRLPGNPKSVRTFKDGNRIHSWTRKSDGTNNLNTENCRKRALEHFHKSRPGLVVTIATVRGTVPLLILYKALGFQTDKDIHDTLLVNTEDLDFNEALKNTFENKESNEIKGVEEALFYIGSKSIKDTRRTDEIVAHGRKLISEEVLPSLGQHPDYDVIKAYHVGYMVNRLISAYLGRIPCDDRDHLANKRFELAGPMLAALFKLQLKSLMNEAKFALTRRINQGQNYDVVKNIIRQKLISRGLVYAMVSGNWGNQRQGSKGRVGVAQLLNRLNGMATKSYLRRIHSPVNRLVRMIDPRQIHTTAFGYLCPADTPEGETVGLMKSLSVMAEITAEEDVDQVISCLEALNYDPMDSQTEKIATNIRIIINSEIVGSCPLEKVSTILASLKNSRRRSEFSNKISISYHPEWKEIIIRTDGGRAFRPLLVVKNNELLLQREHVQRLLNPNDSYEWKDLITDGVIEFLDAAESETAMIAMFPSDLEGKRMYTMNCFSKPLSYKVTYTHCEIHPSMILGVCAALSPYPDHNQSPRNTYQAGMAKQAIGVYQTNFFQRFDPESHILHYPQCPLVTTNTSKFIKYDENPAGINAIAAICCYTGYNQEDSVIINKSAVERGFFRSTIYKTKTDEARANYSYGDEDQIFQLPKRGEVPKFRSTCYVGLDEDGLPPTNTYIENDDPLIGKTQGVPKSSVAEMAPGDKQPPNKIDVSTMHKSSLGSLTSIIDSVMLTNNDEGYRMVRVRTRTPRFPQIGDKFASRHGQKGVVGIDFADIDMPFTKDGITPDIILNPHAIPSRMTIGHLLETVAGKNAALQGKTADGTCFSRRQTVDEMGTELEKFGFHKYGQEVMYNGTTGRKITSQIYMGPVFYQRLRHMTEDKILVRSRGPITELCRQPVHGMHRQGGLRFGEMERDSTISHGAASFLRERLFIASDYYTQSLCKKCGSFLSSEGSAKSISSSRLKCRSCMNRGTPGAVTIEMPYACKLFFQELMSMNIKVRIKTDDDYDNDTTKMIRGKGLNQSQATADNLVQLIMRKMN